MGFQIKWCLSDWKCRLFVSCFYSHTSKTHLLSCSQSPFLISVLFSFFKPTTLFIGKHEKLTQSKWWPSSVALPLVPCTHKLGSQHQERKTGEGKVAERKGFVDFDFGTYVTGKNKKATNQGLEIHSRGQRPVNPGPQTPSLLQYLTGPPKDMKVPVRQCLAQKLQTLDEAAKDPGWGRGRKLNAQ